MYRTGNYIDWASTSYYLCVYILTLGLATLYYKSKRIHLKPEKSKKIVEITLISFTAFPFSLFCALRGIYVGYDTYSYYSNFFIIKELSFPMGIEQFSDIGYYLLNWIVCFFYSNGVRIVFFLMAFMTMLTLIKAFEMYANSVCEFHLALLSFLFYLSPRMLDQSRQLIAVGLATLAFAYLLKGKKMKFFLMIVLGSLLHLSCSVMLLFLLFDIKKVNKYFISIIFITGTIFVSIAIADILPFIYKFLPDQYTYLINQSHTPTPVGLGGLLDIIPVICCLTVFYLNNKKHVQYTYLKCIEACALSAIPFRLAGYTSYFFMRFSYYGYIVGILVLLIGLKECQSKIKKQIITLFIGIIMFLYFMVEHMYLNASGIVPYTF